MVGCGSSSDQLVELLEVVERLQAEVVRAVGESNTRTDWALDGALSPPVVVDASGADLGGGCVEVGGHGAFGTGSMRRLGGVAVGGRVVRARRGPGADAAEP